MFLDEAVVEFSSGKGGSGSVSFHREKHVPRGGPNGADGGRGGDVTLIADRGKRTLYDFKLIDHYEAANGEHATGNKRGKDGKGILLKLPVGTQVMNAATGELVIDLKIHGQKHRLCKGGRGGFGNQHYTNSVRQAPNFAQKGEPTEKQVVKLSLKLIADVGLVGLPNAGKSTLISAISRARPKIADYPFTTIVPNLGVVNFRDYSFVVADMPGLIEGAHRGVGLGHQFLKHVERNRVLIHVIDCFPEDESDPLVNYHKIERELELYSTEIFERPRLIALNKMDIVPAGDFAELREKFINVGPPVFAISAASGQGLEPLLFEIVTLLEQLPELEDSPVLSLSTEENMPEGFTVELLDDGGFLVLGARLEKIVAMTDLENDEAIGHLQSRLERIGVIDKLRELGAGEGDEVTIGDMTFSFIDE